MNAKLCGFFSGFPERRFTLAIAEVLKGELKRREALVFVSCIPNRFSGNDDDSNGMHAMFSEFGMAFDAHFVIDQRTGKEEAKELIRKADCIFLMGGNATVQMKQIIEKEICEDIRNSSAVILGVSAGAMNMGKRTVDIYETTEPYEGLGFLDITVKAHYPLDDINLMDDIRKVSMNIPVMLMTDESAIFVKNGSISMIGDIYRMNKGEITPFTGKELKEMYIDSAI